MPIPMPLWQLPVLVIVPLLVLAGLVILVRCRTLAARPPGEEPDWSVPPLTENSGNSLFYRWDVRCKIVSITGYCFLVASLYHWTSALAAIAVSCLILAVARVSVVKVLMRLLAIVGFITMFAVVMPFTVPERQGDMVLVFGGLEWLAFNLRGLQLAGTIAAKAVAITLLMEPLLATAPLPVTLHGLSKLGAPEIIGQMVLLSYRYIHVFRHEALRMASGMQVRGFRKRSDMATLRAVANFLGMLLVRSFERTERVFDAMRARGYQGRFPEPVVLRLKPSDLILASLWLSVGLALVIYDRLAW